MKRSLAIFDTALGTVGISVPPGVNLVFNLTPGSVWVMNINGKFNVAGSSLVAQPAEEAIKANGAHAVRR